jgi:spore germination cell wall hydrolase CwlJ-like protein
MSPIKRILTESITVISMVLAGASIVGIYTIFTIPASSALAQPVIDIKVKQRPLAENEFYLGQKISLSQKQFNCLALNIYYESGVESYNGKIAVAQVTWNRVKHNRWGNTICKVVYDKNQFSWTRNKKIAKPKGILWEDSIAAARDFTDGIRISGLGESYYYHATWIDAPVWTEKLNEKKTIGQHIFYAYN